MNATIYAKFMGFLGANPDERTASKVQLLFDLMKGNVERDTVNESEKKLYEEMLQSCIENEESGYEYMVFLLSLLKTEVGELEMNSKEDWEMCMSMLREVLPVVTEKVETAVQVVRYFNKNVERLAKSRPVGVGREQVNKAGGARAEKKEKGEMKRQEKRRTQRRLTEAEREALIGFIESGVNNPSYIEALRRGELGSFPWTSGVKVPLLGQFNDRQLQGYGKYILNSKKKELKKRLGMELESDDQTQSGSKQASL